MNTDTISIGKGILAGFVATVVLSALMVVKGMMGMMPQLNVITMLGTMTGGGAVMGWIGHFVIGTILWGTFYVLLIENLPGKAHWQKGTWFGAGAWLLMMILVMPMAGAGLFGLSIGVMAPVMTLILHIIFGIVLAEFYGRALTTRSHAHEHAQHASR